MLLCLFLAPTVLHSEGRRVYFSSLSIYYPGFSLAWDGGTTFSWEFHSKCSLSLSLGLPNVLSLWKRASIMPGYPEEEEGKQGVCNPK